MGAAADTTPVTAETIEGRTVKGTWTGLTGGGAIQIDRQGQAATIAIPDLLAISWPTAASKPAIHAGENPLTVFLRDGSTIPCRLLGGNARTITLETAMIGRWEIPLSTVAGVRFVAVKQSESQAAFDQALVEPGPAHDTLLLTNDGKVQSLHGVTDAIEPAGIRFRWRERSIPVPPDRAIGIIFAQGTGAKPSPPAAACQLDDGSIWCGSIESSDRNSVCLRLTGGQTVRIPLPRLREIRFNSDRLIFLSDLEPAKFEFEPFGATHWPWRRNRSVANRPLRIDGQSFTRGLGVHSRTVLTYALDGTYTQLAAIIGIDDGARPRGNVIFRVTTDGKEVFNSGPVTGKDKPRPILVPIHKARSLELIVDFGQDLDLGDQADWCDARLIR